MKRIFVDINIFLDYYIGRGSLKNIEGISKIFENIENNLLYGICSLHTITTLYYIMKNYKIKHKNIMEFFDWIEAKFLIVGGDNETVKNAINNNFFKDFEDGVQYQLSLENFAEVIITNNIDDFKNSAIECLNPVDFLKKYL